MKKYFSFYNIEEKQASLFFDNFDEIDLFENRKDVSVEQFCNNLVSNIKKSIYKNGAGSIETEYMVSRQDLRTQPFLNGLLSRGDCFEKSDYHTGILIKPKNIYEFAKADLELGIYHQKEDKIYSSVDGFKNHLAKQYGEDQVEKVFQDKVLNEGVRHIGVVYYHPDSNMSSEHYIKMPELWSFSNPEKLIEIHKDFKNDFEKYSNELENIVNNFKPQDLFKNLGTDLGEVLRINEITTLSPHKYDEFVNYCKSEEQREVFEQAFKVPLKEEKELNKNDFNNQTIVEVKEVKKEELEQNTKNKKPIEFKGIRNFTIEKEIFNGCEVDVYKDSKNQLLNGKFKIGKHGNIETPSFVNLKDGKLENYLDDKGKEQPAYTKRDRISFTECFYKNGLLHNTNGTAYNYLNTYDSYESFNRYFIEGKETTKDEVKIYKEKEDLSKTFKVPTVPKNDFQPQQFKGNPSTVNKENKKEQFQSNKPQLKTKRIEI